MKKDLRCYFSLNSEDKEAKIMSKVSVLLLNGALILHLLGLPIAAKTATTADIFRQFDVTYWNCIDEVFQKQFSGSSVTVMLPKLSEKIGDSFIKILHRHFGVGVIDRNSKRISISPMYQPSNFLFITSSRLDLIGSMKYAKVTGNWNPKARVLIVLSNEMVTAKQASLLNMSEMKKIFRLFMNEGFIHVTVVTFDERKVPKIFAWYPYHDENNCSTRVQKIRLVGQCLSDSNALNGRFIIKTNYTDMSVIPQTFNGCPLTISVLKMEPYTLCDQNLTCDRGIEILLFKSVSRSLNLSLQLKVERNFGKMYKSLLQRESDLLIGGINPWTKVQNTQLTQTVPYYKDELTWCVLQAKEINPWLNGLFLADAETAVLFTCMIFISGFLLYCLFNFYYREENLCFCLAATFFASISYVIPINPKTTLLRTYFAIICLYGILANAVISSYWMSTFAKPLKFAQVSTKEQIVQKYMEIYGDNETMALYKYGRSKFTEHLETNFRSCIDIDSCLDKFLSPSSDRIAVSVSREHAMYYPPINNKIYCFRNPESIYPVAALAHKHYHLLDTINQEIQKVLENGLIKKWAADIKSTRKPKIVSNEFFPFSINNLSGGFIVLSLGLLLANFGFVSELYFKSKKKSSNSTEPALWRVCEKIWVTKERNALPEVARYFRWKTKKP